MGIIDLLTQLLTDIKGLLLLAGLVVAAFFIIMKAVTSKFAVPALLISGLAVGFFLFALNSPQTFGDLWDNEVK